MTAGIAASFANSALNTIAASALWVQLHTGDPGAAGTANISSTATRIAITWNGAAAGSMTSSNVPNWGNWAGTSPEIITHVSFWTLVTAGVFVDSELLAAPVTVQTGFPLTLAAQTIGLAAVAA